MPGWVAMPRRRVTRAVRGGQRIVVRTHPVPAVDGLVTDGLHVGIGLEARQVDRGIDRQGIAADHRGDLARGRAVGAGGGENDDAVRIENLPPPSTGYPGQNLVARVAAPAAIESLRIVTANVPMAVREAGERAGRGRIDADVVAHPGAMFWPATLVAS